MNYDFFDIVIENHWNKKILNTQKNDKRHHLITINILISTIINFSYHFNVCLRNISIKDNLQFEQSVNGLFLFEIARIRSILNTESYFHNKYS